MSVFQEIKREMDDYEKQFGRQPTHISIGHEKYVEMAKEGSWQYCSPTHCLGMRMRFDSGNEIRVGRM